MGLNFPNAPTSGQQYPSPPIAGLPVYTWDGEKWVTGGTSTTGTPPSDVLPLADGVAAIGTMEKYARGDHVHPAAAAAPINSPVFTGDPQAPTPPPSDNDFSIATTQFVKTAVAGVTPPSPATAPPSMDAAAAVGTATKYAREDHVHPTDTSRAAASAIPAAATAAEYLANSAPTKMLTPGAAWGAAAPVTLADGATVTPDFNAGIDFAWTLGAAGRTLQNPTNIKPGQKGVIYLIQDATGGRTITTWGSFWKFPGGTKPVLSTAPNAVDILSYVCSSATGLFASTQAGFA